MPASTTLATEYNALLARVVSLEASRTKDEAAFTALAAKLTLDEATIATLVAAGTPPPPPPPTVDPLIQWRGTMEDGTLSAWSEQVNTGTAGSSAVLLVNEGILPRVSKLSLLPSLYAMKQSCSPAAGASAGTRMSRYPEINALCKAGTPFYYSWWDFFPAAITIGSGGWFNLWQIMSNSPAGVNTPMWVMGLNGTAVNITSDPTGSLKTYTSTVAVPAGQWNFFEVYVLPRADASGALKVWVNKQLALDIPGVATQYPLGASLLCYTANNCYGLGVSPNPFIHYVDDVTVSLGRMP